MRLAELLEERCNPDSAMQVLRARADVGDKHAAGRLTVLLRKAGDQDGLQARADAGDQAAARHLAELLAERDDLDGLQARADAGDQAAARHVAELLYQAGDLDGVRARADAGDQAAAGRLAELLAEHGDLDELQARADAGDQAATWRLPELLYKAGDLTGAIQILGPHQPTARLARGPGHSSMAALLMPGRTFKDVAFEQMTKLGLSGRPSGPDLADTLTAAIADVFQVSKQAALIRLDTLRIVQAG